MNLIADIGNTVLKLALSQNGVISKTFRHHGESEIDFICDIAAVYHPETTAVCSVKTLSDGDVRRLQSVSRKLLILDGKHREIPGCHLAGQDLRADYLVCIYAVRHLFPGRNFSIFDFGTDFNIVSGGEGGIRIETLTHDFSNRFTKETVETVTVEMEKHLSECSDAVVVFTGGDANYFAKRTKNCIFVVCNLVLLGLALIVERYE